MTRDAIADFVAALILVYVLLIIAWIALRLILDLGWWRPVGKAFDGVYAFLRDTTEPYLGLFRRLGLRVGPLDLSPLVAIIVLQVVGNIVVGLIRG